MNDSELLKELKGFASFSFYLVAYILKTDHETAFIRIGKLLKAGKIGLSRDGGYRVLKYQEPPFNLGSTGCNVL